VKRAIFAVWRACALALCALGVAPACVSTQPCRDGTVLLAVTLSGGAEAADEIRVRVALDGAGELQDVPAVPHQPGDATGTLELTLSHYGAHHVLRVELQAWGQQGALGIPVQKQIELSGACQAAALELTVGAVAVPPDSGADGLSDDGSGGDDAQGDAIVDAGGDTAEASTRDGVDGGDDSQTGRDGADGPVLPPLADAADGRAPADVAPDRAPGDSQPDLAPDTDPCGGASCSGATLDGCCPASCNAMTDHDCAGCGNGRVEGGEMCDPASAAGCPTDCPKQLCQRYKLVGGGTCLAHCEKDVLIQACADDDGCCPSGCDGNKDNDCKAVCGNNVVESTEKCDPVSDCRAKEAACIDDDEHIRKPMGVAVACTFVCNESPRPCQSNDGFCPSGCVFAQDAECKKSLGSQCGGNQECDGGMCVDGHCCITTCAACQACTGAGGTCMAIARFSEDNVPANTCTGANACDGNSMCKRKLGQACGSDGSQCVSGACVDGVCCESACSGTCRNCNLLGAAGVCSVVTNATDNTCQSGSHCDSGGSCRPDMVCGDGQVTGNEMCDDNNGNGGDGCSSFCQIEAGWTCPIVGASCHKLPSDGGTDSGAGGTDGGGGCGAGGACPSDGPSD
jgi:cysteine-rich repeat protein